jgi:hypothetical protein
MSSASVVPAKRSPRVAAKNLQKKTKKNGAKVAPVMTKPKKVVQDQVASTKKKLKQVAAVAEAAAAADADGKKRRKRTRPKGSLGRKWWASYYASKREQLKSSLIFRQTRMREQLKSAVADVTSHAVVEAMLQGRSVKLGSQKYDNAAAVFHALMERRMFRVARIAARTLRASGRRTLMLAHIQAAIDIADMSH